MKKYTLVALSLIAFNLLSVKNSFAKEKVDKSKYHLFNPTPKEKMRGLNTDRPDKTESAYTVDAGHFQFETDLLTFSQDTKNKDISKELGINIINLKAGLTNFMDIQMVVPSYIISYEKDKSISGFGDIQTRLKISVWGNEDDNAISIMPYIKIPTNSNNLGNKFYEGGIIIPAVISLPYDFSLGSTFTWNYLRNDEDTSYINRFVASLSLGHENILGDLGGYIEIFSDKNLQGSDWVVTLDGGITYPITENIQLDGGINIGVTPEADDFNPFLGLSMQF